MDQLEFEEAYRQQLERDRVKYAGVSEAHRWAVERMAGIGEAYLPVANLAQIPITQVGGFLYDVNARAIIFVHNAKTDDDRRKLRVAINKVKTATNRLLLALEYLDKREGGPPMLDCFFQLKLGEPFNKWSKSQLEAFTKSLWTDALPDGGLLPDYKRQLAALQDAAEECSAEQLPKRGENRTKKFIKEVLHQVNYRGGNLTYDKNLNTGTLAEAVAFFRAKMPPGSWTDLSPSTLQRLKSSR